MHCVVRIFPAAAAIASSSTPSAVFSGKILPAFPTIFPASFNQLTSLPSSLAARRTPASSVPFARPLNNMAAAVHATRGAVDLEAFGKAASGSGSPSKQRGDCPFSQRIYLDLEEKGIPYTATFIEEGDNKPSWFLEKNPSGLIPVLRDGDIWIQDSDKIAQHLEEKFPDPSLKTPPHVKEVGIGIFPAFTSWLKSKNVNGPEKEEFVKELKAFDEHLKSHGPFIAGTKPTDSDFALAPKLRHARTALEHFVNFRIPDEFTALKTYIQKIESRPSFQKTDSPDDMIIQGWQKKFQLPDRIA